MRDVEQLDAHGVQGCLHENDGDAHHRAGGEDRPDLVDLTG